MEGGIRLYNHKSGIHKDIPMVKMASVLGTQQKPVHHTGTRSGTILNREINAKNNVKKNRNEKKPDDELAQHHDRTASPA